MSPPDSPPSPPPHQPWPLKWILLAVALYALGSLLYLLLTG